jgi:nucleotide-binding universal stress UspA family protein
MLGKLLLPVDFSDRVYGPARYTRTLAHRFQSSITLLHVLPPPHYEFGALEIGGPMLTELYATRAAHVRAQLETFLTSELAGVPLERVVLEGDPARKIVAYAHDNRFDLIVMPTHGYGPFRRFILGSITAKVLHDSDVPVWTGVHMQDAPREGDIEFHQVLCAVELRAASSAPLEWASRFCAAYGARLTIVHATAPIAPELSEGFDPSWRKEFETEAREELARLRDRSAPGAAIAVESGDPASVVCDAAHEIKADLLVIGRGTSERLAGRLRAQAYSIIRQSPCPVISV